MNSIDLRSIYAMRITQHQISPR